jgi:hypothetical protein
VRRLAALLLVACAAEEPAPVPLPAWGTSAMDALCTWMVACRHVPDDAQCRRNLDPKQYDITLGTQAVAEGRIVYDGVAAARCFAATVGAPCAAVALGDPRCDEVFAGQVAAGGTCYTSKDCLGGGDCVDRVCDERQCCPGTCAAPEPPEPEPVRRPIGSTCVTHADCVLEAHCGFDRVCAALPDRAGQPCVFGCAWGDLRCDLATLTCVAFRPLGEACGSDVDCDEAYAYCDGVCRAIPGPGEACDLERRRCIPTAWCDGEVCQPRGEAGAACASDEHCVVGCDEVAGRCVARSSCPE